VAVFVGNQRCAQLATLARARLGLKGRLANPPQDRTERLWTAHDTVTSVSNAAPHPVAGSKATCGLVPSAMGVTTA
jgi:hypothetical protein